MGKDQKMTTFGEIASDVTGDSFADWVFRLEAYLYTKDMKELAPLAARMRKGEAVDISDTIASKNEDLFYILVMHTGGDAVKLMRQADLKGNGLAALNALYLKYNPQTMSSKMQVFTDLADCKIGANETDVESYNVRLGNLIEQVDNMADTKAELIALMKSAMYIQGLRGRKEIFSSFTTAMLIVRMSICSMIEVVAKWSP